MDLLLVRHAAIAYLDRDGRPLDAVAENPPLTALGERQAAALALRLRRAGLTHLYSSPAVRCLQTAQAIGAAAGLSGTAEAWLGETGRLWEDWARRPPHGIPRDFPRLAPGPPPTKAEWGFAADEGSPDPERRRAAVFARCRKVLDTLLAAHPPASGDRVCLCLHHGLGGSGLLPVLLGTADVGNGRFALEHASLTEVRCDARGHVVLRVNCTRHLAGLTVALCSDPACGHRAAHRDERTCHRCGAPMLSRCPTCATTSRPTPAPHARTAAIRIAAARPVSHKRGRGPARLPRRRAPGRGPVGSRPCPSAPVAAVNWTNRPVDIVDNTVHNRARRASACGYRCGWRGRAGRAGDGLRAPPAATARAVRRPARVPGADGPTWPGAGDRTRTRQDRSTGGTHQPEARVCSGAFSRIGPAFRPADGAGPMGDHPRGVPPARRCGAGGGPA